MLFFSTELSSFDEEVEKVNISSTKALFVNIEKTSPLVGEIDTSVVSKVNSQEKELIEES